MYKNEDLFKVLNVVENHLKDGGLFLLDCFNPNIQQEVEIGYGLGKDFERNGYMTEAVQAMCKWALKQECVSHIIAQTDIDGFASQRILQRCGFVEKGHEKTIWWRL